MNRAANLNKETKIELAIPQFFTFIIRYLRTHWNLLTKPSLFIENRAALPAGIVNPSTCLFWTMCTFCLALSFFPLFSAPSEKMHLLQALNATRDFLQTHTLMSIIWYYLQYVVVALASIVIPVLACYIVDKDEAFSIAGIGCYMLSGILDFIIFRYILEVFIIKGLYFVHAGAIVEYSIRSIHYLDFVFLIGLYPIFRMAYCLSKAYGGWGIAFVWTHLAILIGVGIYFISNDVKRLPEVVRYAAPDPRPLSSSALPIYGSDSSIQASVPDTQRLMVKLPPPSLPHIAATDSFMDDIPVNSDILISPISKDDSLIHVAAHRMYGRYWLETSFAIRNTTNTPITFTNNKVLVNLSLGQEALRTQDRAFSRRLYFQPFPGKNINDTLESGVTKTIIIRYPVSHAMYGYFLYQCKTKEQAVHTIFIQLGMQAKGNAIRVNRQEHWDYPNEDEMP